MRYAEGDIVLAGSALNHGAQVLEVAVAQVILQVLVASGYAHAVVLRGGEPSQGLFLPVDALAVLVVLCYLKKGSVFVLETFHVALSTVDAALVVQQDEFLDGEDGQLLGDLLDPDVAVEADRHL